MRIPPTQSVGCSYPTNSTTNKTLFQSRIGGVPELRRVARTCFGMPEEIQSSHQLKVYDEDSHCCNTRDLVSGADDFIWQTSISRQTLRCRGHRWKWKIHSTGSSPSMAQS